MLEVSSRWVIQAESLAESPAGAQALRLEALAPAEHQRRCPVEC